MRTLSQTAMDDARERPLAIVTGAGSGIGAHVVDRLAARGCTVVAVDLRFGESAPHPGVRRIVGDVVRTADCLRAVAAADGPVDHLVNVAAVRDAHRIDDTEDEDWERCQAVNATGAFRMMRAASPALRSGASVINVASAAAFGKTGLGAYGASKASLISLSRTAALEWADRGIRVNVVLPGTTDTPMLTGARASGTGTQTSRAVRNLGGSVLSPQAVAAEIDWLLGGSLVTGAIIPVGLLPWEW